MADVVGQQGQQGISTDEAGTQGLSWAGAFRYLLIPTFAALIGWGTNVLALKMTFYPLEYVGFGERNFRRYGVGPWHLGWQGIVPSKAAKMARTAIAKLTGELVDVQEVFSRIDPEQVAVELEPVMYRTLSAIVSEVARAYAPDVWASLPLYVREEIVGRVKEDTPALIAAVMSDIRADVSSVLDLDEMVVTHLVGDKQLLVSVFMRAAARELRFIEASGAYFGFALGLVQALVFSVWHSWLVLPAAGFVSGYVTNWIALKLIFEPVRPRRCCCGRVELQGLFLKNQAGVSEAFGSAVATEIMSSEQLLVQLFLAPSSHKAIQIVHFHVAAAIDRYSLALGPLLPLALGGEEYEQMKRKVRAPSPCAARLPRLAPPLTPRARAARARRAGRRAVRARAARADQGDGALLHRGAAAGADARRRAQGPAARGLRAGAAPDLQGGRVDAHPRGRPARLRRGRVPGRRRLQRMRLIRRYTGLSAYYYTR